MTLFNNVTEDFYNNLNNLGTNPFVLVVLILIIIVYYILFTFLGNSITDDDDYEPSMSFFILQALLWGLFILLIFVNGLAYFFNIDVVTELKNIFSKEPEITVKSTVSKSDISLNFNEVYHVPGNRFTYHDAKAVCNAFEGEMATYEQLRESQNKGASWCSYGWTKDQL